ncbi:MAG: polyprenyl synthetase family protein [Bacteroidia bacterium]
MKSLEQYSDQLKGILAEFNLPQHPENLYASIDYILSLGGKRLRPLMVLMSADAFGASNTDAEKMALVVELFHNFSLMHDDIMDNADLRRGKPSVHVKWDIPTAILGGDALLVKTYQVLMKLKGAYRDELIDLYNTTAIEVCEGQQMDMNFENREAVSIKEYTEMIRLKTAVLMGAAFKMGAVCSEADSKQQNLMYDFGQYLGIAFQIKDDFLDCFGSDAFGKKVGGDIIENKKTYLQLKALELGSTAQNEQLKSLWAESDETKKIEAVKQLFEDTGAKGAAEEAMNEYYQKGLQSLSAAELNPENETYLAKFAEYVWLRDK